MIGLWRTLESSTPDGVDLPLDRLTKGVLRIFAPRQKRHRAVKSRRIMERARRFERPTLTLARLCSTPELRPLCKNRHVVVCLPECLYAIFRGMQASYPTL